MTGTDELPVVPISGASVGSMICDCGVCGASIEFDLATLDDETGRIRVEEAFGHCPECEAVFDATAARFSAWDEPKEEEAQG